MRRQVRIKGLDTEVPCTLQSGRQTSEMTDKREVRINIPHGLEVAQQSRRLESNKQSDNSDCWALWGTKQGFQSRYTVTRAGELAKLRINP